MRSEASSSGGSSRNSGRGESVVVDAGRRKSTCGYCKSGARTSISHGLWADNLTVDDYQALLDRGWRRSGCYLYKPEMDKTCCPSYTIRLKANDFVPSKEQIRVTKRMQRFLDGALEVKKSAGLIGETEASKGFCCSVHDSNKSSDAMDPMVVDCKSKDKANNQFIHSLSDEVDHVVQLCLKSGEFSSDVQLPKASVKRVAPSKRKLQADILEDLMFSCNIAFQIAASLRREKKDVEVVKSSELCLGVTRDSSELSPKTIAEILASHLKQMAASFGLSVRACNGHINFYSTKEQFCFDEEIGSVATLETPTGDEGNKRHSKRGCQCPQGQKVRLEIQLKKSSFDYEEYSLYKKYQLRVHNDTLDHVTESSYKRFLVDTPLIHIQPTGDVAAPPCGFGSFHQQYVLDGKLIAVGVIDILPNCLSSKYLFWDPDLAFLSLGKFSALEEIRWINENQMHWPSLQYYYLGYYLHSCSKMRYKAAYRPSELLCPLRYQWVSYDIAKPLLDRRKYVPLSDFSALPNGDPLLPNVFDDIMEEQQNDFIQCPSSDTFVNEDEMAELESEDSEGEDELEAGGETTVELGNADLSNLLIGLRGARLRYRSIQHMFDSNQRKSLEAQLQRYVQVVGTELSNRIVYSLG